MVTRAEHQAAIARLDQADSDLRNSIAETERILRTDYEGKISAAVASVNGNLVGLKTDLKGDIDEVKVHLTAQDDVLGGISQKVEGSVWFQRTSVAIITMLVGTLLTFAVFAAVHYLWG